MSLRERIAKRAAEEIQDGMVVNLGIGIPSLIPNFLLNKPRVMIQAENGVLGIGPSPALEKENEHLCNAAGYPVTLGKGASYFDSALSFGMIRKGLIDMTILGSLQVSSGGDLANWIVPGRRVPGMGGAMELAQKAKRVIVLMNHTNKDGTPKIVNECTLPLTARNCVNLIITEMAVMEITENGLCLKETLEPFTVEDVIKKTEASFFQ
ncbi:3-oxoacid CoA-transferase subunit B [Metabacillus arenae]